MNDQIWLVKSTNRILGPIAKSEMVKKIRSREIHLTDDACSPGRRWFPIQTHPDLRDVIEEIRRMVISEETEVSWTPGNLTQTVTDFSDSDLTEELSDKISQSDRTTEIVIHDLPAEEKRSIPQAGAARFQATAAAQSIALKKRAERTTRWLWVTTTLVLALALVIVVQKRVSNQEIKALSLESLQSHIPELVQNGEYALALKDLKSYYRDPLQSGALGIYMGPLLIQVENQTVVGRRVLNQMLAAGIGDPKLELTGLGIADLMEGQLNAAQENFTKALAIDRNYVPAMINLGIVFHKRSQFDKAREMLLAAIRINGSEGEAQLALAENALRMSQAPMVNEALTELAKYRAQQLDFEPEAAFYTLYLEWMKSGRRVGDDKVMAFLEVDPQLTDDHRHNVFVFKGLSRWTALARLCEQVSDQMGDSVRSSTLRAVCFSKEGRKAEARMWIEKAVQQSPTDAIAQSWYSFILNENGMGDQASVALGRANELNRKGEYQLPMIMQARFCEQAGDQDCARQNWNRLMQKNGKAVSAFGGLATGYVQRGAFTEATTYIDRGLSVSPSYIPLLRLKSKGQKAGWYGRS